MDAVVARQCWRATEPVHAQVYFSPEPREELAALGHDLAANPAAGYFVPRSAAFGAVGPGAVVGSFFSFAPALVELGLRTRRTSAVRRARRPRLAGVAASAAVPRHHAAAGAPR